MCPICGRKLKQERYFEGGALLEEYTKCQDEHHLYYYEFVHGNSLTVFNSISFIFSWDGEQQHNEWTAANMVAMIPTAQKEYLRKKHRKGKEEYAR